jgi:Domain of unknown function DUF11/PASTA domain
MLGGYMKARSLLSVLVVALALPAAASASTTTLGSIVEPAVSATPQDCGASPDELIGQATPAYEVGTNGALVTSWSVNATGDGSGTETLYVLAPSGSGYTVVGVDAETLPATIPVGGTVTFTLPTPIPVTSGDTFGLTATGTGHVYCGWEGAATSDLVFEVGPELAPPSVGQTITPVSPEPGVLPVDLPGALVDLAVTLTPGSEDIAVSTTTGPSNAVVNNEALLSSTVTNNGPFAGPTTFTDAVPAGLAIDAVAGANGACNTAGQVVTCTFANLAVGASAAVEIVVTPVAAESYQNTVSVADASGATDPNPTNNSATATLVAAAIPAATVARACVATNLKGLSEKVVKRLLPSLGCKVGKIKKATSKKVAKGDVISLTPGSGSHPAGTKVALTVSSGKPKKKHKG